MEKIENTNISDDAFEIKYKAGEEGKDYFGNDADSSKFSFVQQDKKIHDVKFTTRPTTFLKDAVRRFRKNKSSVVGGAILGMLFLLALILPISMTGVHTDELRSYETHLPMKLFPAGTGFWDGTRVDKNANYPYETDVDGNDVLDDDGNKIFTNYDTYPDENVVVKTTNKKATYSTLLTSNDTARGGYLTASDDADTTGNSPLGYVYNYRYKYDFSKTYNLTFSLGTNADNICEYAPAIFEFSGTSTTPSNTYLLQAYSTNYGEEEELTDTQKANGATITPHKDISITLNNNTVLYDFEKGTATTRKLSNITNNVSFGIIYKKKTTSSTSVYINSFRITGTGLTSSETRQLNGRSFGSNDNFSAADAIIADASTVLSQTKISSSGSDNISYWQSTGSRLVVSDSFVITCDITYDMYLITYGLKNGMDVSQLTLEAWKKDELVEYDSLDALISNPGSFKLTEAGENSNDVYVTEITSVTLDDSTGTKVYQIKAQFMMYKYLGYSSMPIHIFGTEYQGKDMLKYVFSGLRTSLILGIVVSAINIIIGLIWGSISGYYGGAVDLTMERITDILGGIPYIVLMTILTIKLGTTFFVFALSLCLTGWIGTASTTRSQFYRYRGREYVLAAKTLGARPPRLIFRHILPNAIGTIVTRSILMIPSTIFSEATISYLGLGLTNLDSLGVILSKNQAYLNNYAYELVVPAIIISLLMICFNLFGNGLRDAFNPSLKGTE